MGYQLLTSYESTNTMRILTGVPAGFIGGWIFSAMFSARPNESKARKRSSPRKCYSTHGLRANFLAQLPNHLFQQVWESDFPLPKIANLSIVSRTALGCSPERTICPIAKRG